MPQSVSLTSFSSLIPVSSRLDLLGFKSGKDQNMSKTFITFIKDFFIFPEKYCI